MLRHAKVRSVDFSQMDLVASFDERLQQLKDKSTSRAREKSFYVLENERKGTKSGDNPSENGHERISLIVLPPLPGRREALAGRTSSNDRRAWQSHVTAHLRANDMLPHILTIRIRGRSPVIDCANGLKPRARESHRQTPGSAEQIDEGGARLHERTCLQNDNRIRKVYTHEHMRSIIWRIGPSLSS